MQEGKYLMDTTFKGHIVVIDDTAANLTLLNQLLSKKGFKVRAFPSGRLAIPAILNNPPDLILLDIMMPDIDGYEVCRQLKAKDASKHIPVIFISALDEALDKAKAFDVGGTDYITKPFNPMEVLARINNQMRIRNLQLELTDINKLLLSANSQLESQNKELLEAARLRDEIDQITRHDLKSPVSSIISLSQLILTDQYPLHEDQKQHIKMIEDSAYQMLNMINTSLDLYKMEVGTYKFQPKKIELINLIKRVVQDHHIQIKYKQLDLQLLLENYPLAEDASLYLQGDEILCYSIFSNLISNAIEASPHEKPLTLSLQKKQQVIITLSNYGAVPKDIRDHFFDKYVTFGKEHGTGLGTYSAKLMTEVQGGSIHLNATVPDITTILIYLPC